MLQTVAFDMPAGNWGSAESTTKYTHTASARQQRKDLPSLLCKAFSVWSARYGLPQGVKTSTSVRLGSTCVGIGEASPAVCAVI